MMASFERRFLMIKVTKFVLQGGRSSNHHGNHRKWSVCTFFIYGWLFANFVMIFIAQVLYAAH